MDNPWNLAPRQVEVLSLLVDGGAGCNKTVARKLGIDARTVREHLTRALRKMQAKNRIQAVLMWDRWTRGAA